jgi:hypothetical protein
MIDTHAKEEFWKVVEDCLTDIFRLDPSEAHKRCMELRKDVEAPPIGLSGEVIYHDEPFEVAADLADEEPHPHPNHPDLAQHRNQYDAILSRHRW